MSDIAANAEIVQERITAAAHRAGRDPNDITLVAVTKTHPLETAIEAYQAGLRHFGENRVQEGGQKVKAFADWSEAEGVENQQIWHMIGHLQSRQAGEALDRFSLIHSVDSVKLGERINRLAERDNHAPVNILLQCNVSGEATKSGFQLSSWDSKSDQLSTFLEAVDRLAALTHIKIQGLMTMAPIVADANETRIVFQNLAGLHQMLTKERPDISWQHLSMGMTDDFEVAIEEGSTIVRVGRAIFGQRSY
ncbi:MAG: YggS family pyridoxal phosphate-dependent enzyme [Chloroflexota bacterium]